MRDRAVHQLLNATVEGSTVDLVQVEVRAVMVDRMGSVGAGDDREDRQLQVAMTVDGRSVCRVDVGDASVEALSAEMFGSVSPNATSHCKLPPATKVDGCSVPGECRKFEGRFHARTVGDEAELGHPGFLADHAHLAWRALGAGRPRTRFRRPVGPALMTVPPIVQLLNTATDLERDQQERRGLGNEAPRARRRPQPPRLSVPARHCR